MIGASPITISSWGNIVKLLTGLWSLISPDRCSESYKVRELDTTAAMSKLRSLLTTGQGAVSIDSDEVREWISEATDPWGAAL